MDTANQKRYNAFISYSHAAVGKLAPAIQAALHRFAKPWYRLRALRVFRDETTLALTPELWPAIEKALSRSDYFILLASPQAAASRWVRQELEWWLTNRSPQKLLIVLTDGEIHWSDAVGDFEWTTTDALPREVLQKRNMGEPFLLDLRTAKTAEKLSLRDPDYAKRIAKLAAPLHGCDPDELAGEDIRQYRKTRRLAWSAVVALAVFALTAAGAAVVAFQQRQIAIVRQKAAQAELMLNQQPERLRDSVRLAIESLGHFHASMEGYQALRHGLSLLPRMLAQFPEGGHVVFSPEGKYLASATPTGSIHVCESPSGRSVAGVKFQGNLTGIALGPEARFLAVGCDATLRVYELERDRQQAAGGVRAREVWRKGVRPPMTITFSFDGRHIATTSLKSHVRVWRTTNWSELPDYTHEGVTCLVFDRKGDRLLTAGGSEVRSWDLSGSRSQGWPIERVEDLVCFSADASVLATADKEQTVKVWRAKTSSLGVTTGYEKVAMFPHQGRLTALAVSPEGRQIATASKDGTARLWKPGNGREIARMTSGGVSAVAFSPDGKYVSTAGGLWDVQGGYETPRLAHEAEVTALAFGPDGSSLATASRDGVGKVWKFADPPDQPALDLQIQAPPGTPEDALKLRGAVSPNGRYLVMTRSDGEVLTWDLISRQRISRLNIQIEESESDDLPGLAVSHDGNHLAIVTPNEIRIEQLGTSQKLPRYSFKHGATAAAFHPAGRYLATACSDNVSRIWDILSGLEVAVLAHGRELRSIAFGASGEYLVTSELGEATLWRLSTNAAGEVSAGGEFASIKQRGVTAAAVTADGKYLALGTTSGSVHVWNVTKSVEVARVIHGGTLSALAFSRDGKYIATASDDRSARVWLWRSEDLIKEARERLRQTPAL